MIDLEPTKSGIILPILAQPKARRNAITGIHDGCLKVSVTAAPENGKANRAIVKLLATQLGIRKSQLSIVAGETSQRKKSLICDFTLSDLRTRIHNAMTHNA